MFWNNEIEVVACICVRVTVEVKKDEDTQPQVTVTADGGEPPSATDAEAEIDEGDDHEDEQSWSVFNWLNDYLLIAIIDFNCCWSVLHNCWKVLQHAVAEHNLTSLLAYSITADLQISDIDSDQVT